MLETMREKMLDPMLDPMLDKNTAPASPTDVKSLEFDALLAWVTERGHTRFRADQLYRWVHQKGVRDTAAMTNLPAALREHPELRLRHLHRERVLRSTDGTRKLILRTDDGLLLETVIIPMGKGRFTQCVSSQIGCKMGCTFCATAQMPKRMNLEPSEIVDQIYHARAFLDGEGQGEGVDNLVFMGMGEPLDNLEHVVRSLRILMDARGAMFGCRRITVSTVGLVPRIHTFGTLVPVNLAVSLNATTDEVRSQIMPMNRKYPIATLLDALRAYPMSPRRRITIEYVMLGGLNDTDADARRLPELLQGVRCKVNLIPFNPWPGSAFKSPEDDRVNVFRDRLLKSGIQANMRMPKGRDIQAACGMLDGNQPL